LTTDVLADSTPDHLAKDRLHVCLRNRLRGRVPFCRHDDDGLVVTADGRQADSRYHEGRAADSRFSTSLRARARVRAREGEVRNHQNPGSLTPEPMGPPPYYDYRADFRRVMLCPRRIR